MNRILVVLYVFIAVISTVSSKVQADVSSMTADFLQDMITNHTVDFDFILLDVRNDDEVAKGIIASKYCKPYHMSWDYDVLRDEYTMLPKDIAVVIYCRTGNRSLQAAKFLVEKGFTSVASLAQGINSYKGAIEDSTEFKPLSILPAPSYQGNFTENLQVPQKHQAVITFYRNPVNRRFNLQGRVLPQSSGFRNAPVYVLERIGEESTGKVTGIGHLTQEKDNRRR